MTVPSYPSKSLKHPTRVIPNGQKISFYFTT